jgi:hypothetical protein
MKITLRHLLILTLLLISPQFSSTHAQSSIEIIDQEVKYEFGELLNFYIEYGVVSNLENLTLFIQAGGVPTFIGAVPVTGDGQGRFVYDLSARPLPAFSNISYYYQFAFSSGEVVVSPTFQFNYLDNRFNWQELIEEPFSIFWYEGEIIIAQEVLDAAVEGQERILELLQQPPDNQPISIFIYSSEEDLSSSLSSVGQSLVEGLADPVRGAVVVALPTAVDQPLQIQRLIPHELTHIYLYRFMNAEYEYLPAWYSEGLASQMEAYTLPEYDLILERAYSTKDLIPMLHLCQAFPTDPDLALQAYAQSNSIVGYLRQQYGIPVLQALIYAYDQGLSCDRGVQEALGMTLEDLDQEWQNSTFGGGRRTLLIYILLGVLLALIVSLGLFVFSRIKQAEVDDWGGDDIPNPDYETDNDLPDNDIDFRLDVDDE